MSTSGELGASLLREEQKTAVLAITTHGLVLTSNNDDKSGSTEKSLIDELTRIRDALTPMRNGPISKVVRGRLLELGLPTRDKITHTETYRLLNSIITKLGPIGLTFITPVKLIKYSAVPVGICNITSDRILNRNIKDFITKNTNTSWDTISDEDIKGQIDVNLFKEQFKLVVNKTNPSNLPKEKLDFLHKGDSGNTISIFEANNEVIEKIYKSDESDESSSIDDYSDKILMLTKNGKTLDLYKILVNDKGFINLSELVSVLSKSGFLRIVMLDFTCNTIDTGNASERGSRALNKMVQPGLGGKQNKTKKSIKSTSKSRKTKKSRKSRRKR
jgi:hypothetical protein